MKPDDVVIDTDNAEVLSGLLGAVPEVSRYAAFEKQIKEAIAKRINLKAPLAQIETAYLQSFLRQGLLC